LGEGGRQCCGVGGLGGGVFVWAGGVAEPEGSEAGGHLVADRGPFGLGELAVDAGGEVGARTGVQAGGPARGIESGELAGGENGRGGVPVRVVGGVAGFGVGAEDLAGVVGGDLVLVAVGGDDRDVAAPLMLGFEVGGRLAEGERPRGAVADGGAGEGGDACAD
jgi:hypothetical protein